MRDPFKRFLSGFSEASIRAVGAERYRARENKPAHEYFEEFDLWHSEPDHMKRFEKMVDRWLENDYADPKDVHLKLASPFLSQQGDCKILKEFNYSQHFSKVSKIEQTLLTFLSCFDL